MDKQSAQVGMRAPAFALSAMRGTAQERRQVTQDDFLNRWLILLFYPRDFSMVCPTELTALSGRIAEFHGRDCEVLGISTDNLQTHERWLTPRRWRPGRAQLSTGQRRVGRGVRCLRRLGRREHIALHGCSSSILMASCNIRSCTISAWVLSRTRSCASWTPSPRAACVPPAGRRERRSSMRITRSGPMPWWAITGSRRSWGPARMGPCFGPGTPRSSGGGAQAAQCGT